MINQVEKFIVRNHDLTMKWIRLPKTDQLEVLHLIYQHIFGCCIVHQFQQRFWRNNFQVPPPSGAIDLANEEVQDQAVPAVKKTYQDYLEEEEDFEINK